MKGEMEGWRDGWREREKKERKEVAGRKNIEPKKSDPVEEKKQRQQF